MIPKGFIIIKSGSTSVYINCSHIVSISRFDKRRTNISLSDGRSFTIGVTIKQLLDDVYSALEEVN